jgi:hypothetical protein
MGILFSAFLTQILHSVESWFMQNGMGRSAGEGVRGGVGDIARLTIAIDAEKM